MTTWRARLLGLAGGGAAAVIVVCAADPRGAQVPAPSRRPLSLLLGGRGTEAGQGDAGAGLATVRLSGRQRGPQGAVNETPIRHELFAGGNVRLSCRGTGSRCRATASPPTPATWSSSSATSTIATRRSRWMRTRHVLQDR